MNKFNIYVIKLFIKNSIAVGLFVIILLAMSSAYGIMNSLSGYSYSSIDFIKLIYYSSIVDLNKLTPIISAVTTIITIIILMRNNEMLAYMSIGGSLFRLAIPLVLIGILFSLFMIYLEYNIIPKIREFRERTIGEVKGHTFSGNISGFSDMWLAGTDGVIINIGIVDITGKTIHNVKEFITDDEGSIKDILYIEKIVRENNQWVGKNIISTNILDNPPKKQYIASKVVESKLWDMLTSLTTTDIRGFTPSELYTMAKILKEKGANASSYEMSFYFKLSSACSIPILILFIFPVAINFSRNYSLMKNTAVTLVFIIIFVAAQQTGKSFGDLGVIDPISATFGPIVTFLILSIFLLYYRSKAN